MVKARRLLLKNLFNARDLGGYPTADGKVTKFGVFVRSEAPCELPQEDINALRDYGVTLSIDLRGTGERSSRPSSLNGAEGMEYIEKPLFNEAAIFDDKDREASRPGGPGGPGGPGAPGGPGGPPPMPMGKDGPDWGEQYKSMAEESRQWAIETLQLAADCQGALLYHCTTGKDRTGLMTCYLLSICGVSKADIAADYCVSQVYLEPVFAKMRSGQLDIGAPPQGAEDSAPQGMGDSFFKTPAEAMLTLINYLEEKYGGVVEYLRLIGISEEVMNKIRAKFVE